VQIKGRKRRLVISAVNLFEGGPLTVLRDCVASAQALLGIDWAVTVLVHNKSLLADSSVDILEFPKARKSALFRLFYEYLYFSDLSREIDADLWLSLHDLTPIVTARRKAVYCHNPLPFWEMKSADIRAEPSTLLYSKLYALLYAINIKSNNCIIVQQHWMRKRFQDWYGTKNVIVAHPVLLVPAEGGERRLAVVNSRKVFFYPAFPRRFKNFEVICAAAELLSSEFLPDWRVRLTIDGSENLYSASIVRRYNQCRFIQFIGRQDQSNMQIEYRNCDAVLFSSVLETWGLPISEAKFYRKPLIVADAEYARETVGCYGAVKFFNPFETHELVEILRAEILGQSLAHAVQRAEPPAPFAKNWDELFGIITGGLGVKTYDVI